MPSSPRCRGLFRAAAGGAHLIVLLAGLVLMVYAASPFLHARPAADLCRTCHADHYTLAGGPHDRSRHPQKWPQDTANASGPCEACHVPHGARDTGLFRATVDADSYHDAICLSCHADAKWKGHTPTAAIHPRQISPQQKRVPVALVPVDDKGNMRMGCRTCHNVHGRVDPNGQITCRTCHLSHGRTDLLRAMAGEPADSAEQDVTASKLQVRAFVPPNLCSQCHGAEARRRFLFFHDPVKRKSSGL
jgi:predicted CXXCH cytochrome family protein